MENKKLKMADEIHRILYLDFKDDLKYKTEIKDFKKMSAVQKWFIYDKYAKRDADFVIKGNKLLADVLGWNVKWLDGTFPVIIPPSVAEIRVNAFCYAEKVTLIVEPDSQAEEYCRRNDIPFRYGKDADV